MYLLQELEDRSCLYSVLSKAYLNVICAGISLELLLVSRLRDNVLETDLQIFRLTYEMAETYLKYLTPPFSNLKKTRPSWISLAYFLSKRNSDF